MATAKARDGALIHYEVQGEGPDVVGVSYWNCHPSVFDPLRSELTPNHRFITYDERGCGDSSADGPYDLDTCAADLAAVLEAVGAKEATAIATSDGVLRCGRVALERPDLIGAVISVGGTPLGFDNMIDADAMIGSRAVVDTFIRQVENDYRGAVRSLVSAVNQQMSEDEVRERVAQQVAYVPQDVSVARIHAWRQDDSAVAIGKALGERLWLMTGADLAGAWFPPVDELEALIAQHFPEAPIRRVEGGMVSRPDEVAVVLRELLAQRRPASTR